MTARSTIAIGALLAGLSCRPAGPPALAPAGDAHAPAQLDALLAEVWEAVLEHSPLWATHLGDRRFDAVWPDLSERAHVAWLARLDGFAERLAAVDTEALDTGRRISARVLDEWLRRQHRVRVCESRLTAIDQLSGYQVEVGELGRRQVVVSSSAAADYLTRLAGFSALIDQHIDNLERGLARGMFASRVAVERVIDQLGRRLDAPVEDAPELVAADTEVLDAVQRQRFRDEIHAVVKTGVLPALARYRDFLRGTYLPRARQTAGISGSPNGEKCYDAQIEYYTGLRRTAREVHEIGVAELSRLQDAMEEIAKEQGAPNWRAYARSLKESPDQYLSSVEDLIAYNERIVARAEAALPQVFGRLPPIPVGVIPIEEFRAADAPAAYYYRAAEDGSRGAFYYINAHEPRTRPLFNMEALAFHEAIPGHHLQISIAQSLTDLPPFRRNISMGAFVEGWALYAELVADELGLYSSPAHRFGMLTYQAWRAARLVVDTGMHALGWTRERAIEFMGDNVNLTLPEIENEIDRYIVWPGQALGYMLGRMEIQRLREQAHEALGERFDVRAFHDAVLENGPVSPGMLNWIIEQWIAERQRA